MGVELAELWGVFVIAGVGAGLGVIVFEPGSFLIGSDLGGVADISPSSFSLLLSRSFFITGGCKRS